MPAFDFLTDQQKTDLVTYVLNPDAETGKKVDLNDVDDLVKEIPYSHTGYNRWVDPEGNPVAIAWWRYLLCECLRRLRCVVESDERLS